MNNRQFALNHMAAPSLSLEEFFGLAKGLDIDAVEIRNDLNGNVILDGTDAATVRDAATRHGLKIISINALQRFNEWNTTRDAEARALISYAAASGSQAIVLVPVCDNSGKEDGIRQGNLQTSLRALKPLLEQAGIIGLVEPLGFEFCSLRSKREAVDAIAAVGGENIFRLVHDTFHHHLAGEPELFPEATGLIHISGVDDPGVSVSDMRDLHRVLVGEGDRLDNSGQIRALRAAGCAAQLSFEPFAPEVQASRDLAGDLSRSIDFVSAAL
jgi:2-keto-myo-inositol isomerase